MRNLHLFLFILFLSTSLYSVHGQDRENYSLLWEITHAESKKKGYLFGTMHVDDKRAFQFSDQMLPAMEDVEVFALEVHPDSMITSMGDFMGGKDERDRYKRLLGAEDYALFKVKFKTLFKQSIDSIQDNSISTLQSKLLEISKCDNETMETFLDGYLYGIARGFEKEITGLEQAEDQVKLFTDANDEEALSTLRSIMDSEKMEWQEFLEQFKLMYYSGDIEAINQSYFKEESEADKQIMRERNVVMTQSIDSIMRQKSLFSAVGAAHMAGDIGIIKMLRDKGHTVRKVNTTFDTDPLKQVFIRSLDYWKTLDVPEKGYSIKVPSPAMDMEQEGVMEMKFHMDLSSSLSVFHMTMAVPDTSSVMQDIMMNSFRKNMSGKFEGEATVKEGEIAGHRTLSMQGIAEGKPKRIFITIANKMLYMLGADFPDSEQGQKGANYFFNSFQIKEVLEPDVEFVQYDDPEGAYTVNIPGEYSKMVRKVPNPLEEDGDPYLVKMMVAQNPKLNILYLIRYMDFPLGYYLEDYELGISSLKESLEQNGREVTEVKRFSKYGVEVNDIYLNMGNDISAIMRVMYRGNRSYALLIQATNPAVQVSPDNVFFNSFDFTEFKKPSFVQKTHNGVQLNVPHKNTFFIDKENSNEASAVESKIIAGVDTLSGGVYITRIEKLGKYYQINKSEKEFFKEYIETNHESKYSIINSREVDLNGVKGREYTIKLKSSPLYVRYKFAFLGDNLLLQSAFLDESQINIDSTDSYFDSTKYSGNSSFDPAIDKSNLIFKDLKSKDSLTFTNASIATDYYEFSKKDRKKLEKLARLPYRDDSLYYGTKRRLLYSIALLNDSKSLPFFESLYMSQETTDDQKAMIIEALAQTNYKEGLELMVDLTSRNLIDGILKYDYEILEYTVDSALIANNLVKKTADLMRVEKYRSKALSFLIRNYKDNNKVFNYIRENEDQLMEDMIFDIKVVTDTLTANKDYSYYANLDKYLQIVDTLNSVKPLVIESIKDLAFINGNTSFVGLKAFEFLIKNEIKVEKESILDFIEPWYFRFEGMKVLAENSKSSFIPDSYFTTENYGYLSVYFNTYDDEQTAVIDQLGYYTHNSDEYIVFQYGYEQEKQKDAQQNEPQEKYLAIVLISEINRDDLSLYDIDFSYDPLGKDWKESVKSYFTEKDKKE